MRLTKLNVNIKKTYQRKTCRLARNETLILGGGGSSTQKRKNTITATIYVQDCLNL